MIKIICGVYGGADGMKRPGDAPFSLPPAEEARLVARKVAVYVNEPAVEAPHDEYVPDDAPIGFDEMPPADFVDDAETEEEPIDLSALSAKELREIGKEYGLTFKANDKRATMIEAIEAAQREIDAAPDDAPTFDPTEAVE